MLRLPLRGVGDGDLGLDLVGLGLARLLLRSFGSDLRFDPLLGPLPTKGRP